MSAIFADEAWDEPILEHDPDEALPILKTDIFRSTPHESFEERMERDRKAIEGEFARHFPTNFDAKEADAA